MSQKNIQDDRISRKEEKSVKNNTTKAEIVQSVKRPHKKVRKEEMSQNIKCHKI